MNTINSYDLHIIMEKSILCSDVKKKINIGDFVTGMPPSHSSQRCSISYGGKMPLHHKATEDPFTNICFTLIPAWMSNDIHYKVWDEITCPFPIFNYWSLGMDKLFHPTFNWACDYVSMLVLKLIHVSKRVSGTICVVVCSSIQHRKM